MDSPSQTYMTWPLDTSHLLIILSTVELHSVIAELSRKLESGKDDIIPEESEIEEGAESYATDSCLEDNEDELDDDEQEVIEEDPEIPYDHDSLAFERDLEKDEHLYVDKSTLYKIELFDELQSEVAETRHENERLRQTICDRDRDLEESDRAIIQLQTERESLKRQLEDLQSTLEYQEAKMENRSGRTSAERRSLRRKKSAARPPMSPTEPEKVCLCGMHILRSVSFLLFTICANNIFMEA